MCKTRYGLTSAQLQRVLQHPKLGPAMREIIQDVQRRDKESLHYTLQQDDLTGLPPVWLNRLLITGTMLNWRWANSAGTKWNIGDFSDAPLKEILVNLPGSERCISDNRREWNFQDFWEFRKLLSDEARDER